MLVVERERFPREKACSEYLSPEATRDLDALGVLEEIEASGAAKLTGMRIVADDGSAGLGRFPVSEHRRPYRPYGLALPRSRLDTAVLGAAAKAGAEVLEGVTVERLLFEDGVVVGAMLRRGDRRWEQRSRALVGADGLHSLVVAWGLKNALQAAFLAHMVMCGLLLAFGLLCQFRIAYLVGWLLIVLCLALEHWIARRRSLNWINLAFFRLNAVVSVIFLAVTLAEVVFLGGFRLH